MPFAPRHLALAYAAFLPQTEFEAATDETLWPDYMTLRVLFFRFITGGMDFSVAPASMDAWWGGVDHPGSDGSPD